MELAFPENAYPDLCNKIILITGGSGGIGQELVLVALERGARVAFSWMNNAQGMQKIKDAATKKELAGQLLAVRADLSEANQIEEMFACVLDHFGGLDVLVNNAGISHDALLASLETKHWDQIVATNLTAPFITCKYAVEYFLKKEVAGCILNIGSLAQLGAPSNACYAASKGGLVGLTHSIARDFADKGITANLVALGLVETPLTADYAWEAKQVLIQSSPLKRCATPQEAALNLLFFISEAGKGLNGQVVYATEGIFEFPLVQ